MPTHLTSMRGRGGGFGSETQHLLQHFFRLSDSGGSEATWAMQTLLHTYVYPGTNNNPTYANMNVDVSFPLWTDNWDSTKSEVAPANDGSQVTNVMKIIVSTTAPVAEYYGFWVPRGEPFMKSSGKNEIEVKTSRSDV